MLHRIALVVYPGFELLDASGPASVFSKANDVLRKEGRPPLYAVTMMSTTGGLVTSSAGAAVQTQAIARRSPTSVNTLLIAGGEEARVRAVIADPAVRRWVPRCATSAGRFGSVCSGVFVLAALGLLHEKRVATHWNASAQLRDMYPTVDVDGDALYVVDGKVWTSAGVTTGIDMALAMVAHDVGSTVASEVAKQLVLYARRPGHQSQFSALLRAQIAADNPFADLVAWIQANLDRPLDVAALARYSGRGERTFYRQFVAVMHDTPARFVETLRLDAAKLLLSQAVSIKAIAVQVGLSPTSRFAEAFERRFGLSPTVFRAMHTRL
jgi:transcriptional regulator GlxA family with amidase domain